MTEITVKRDSDGKIFTFYKKVLPHNITQKKYIYIYNKENDKIVFDITLEEVEEAVEKKKISIDELLTNIMKTFTEFDHIMNQ